MLLLLLLLLPSLLQNRLSHIVAVEPLLLRRLKLLNMFELMQQLQVLVPLHPQSVEMSRLLLWLLREGGESPEQRRLHPAVPLSILGYWM